MPAAALKENVASKGIAGVVASLGVAVAIVGALAYAADYGIGSTVVGKRSDTGGRYVVAELEYGGFMVKKYVPLAAWGLLQDGNYAVYHVRSGVTDVYESKGGRLLFRG